MHMGQILGSIYDENSFEKSMLLFSLKSTYIHTSGFLELADIHSSIEFCFAQFLPDQKQRVFQAKKINLPGWNSKV